jgi:hypothetical protein
MKIAHIVNPVKVPRNRDLHFAQPVTFETMRLAKAAASGLDIEQHAAFFPEDAGIVPDFIRSTPPLDRSILELGRFPREKKLPFIKDILDRLYYISGSEYSIYSNVDIALTPQFYLRIAELLEQGYDGFAVNRRTISKRFTRVEDIPLMLQILPDGSPHPGFDCFVFRRDIYTRFKLGNGCVGANWIGRIILSNIMAFSNRFEVFKDKHWTFHIGDDRIWMKNGYDGYNAHNERELVQILGTLREVPDVRNQSELEDMYYFHIKKLLWQGIPKNIQTLNAPVKKTAPNIYPGPSQESTALRSDPVFIVGFPRSGTTLVQALLATQPGIITLPETHFFSMVCRFIQVKKGSVLPECLTGVVKVLRTRISFSRNAENHIRSLAEKGTLTLRRLFEAMLVDNFMEKAGIQQLNTFVWIEKTPHHVFQLDRIFSLYPSARIVYVMRNPEKAILSRRKNFVFNDEYLWPVRKHARQWMNGLIHLEKWQTEKPGSVYVVRLEDLVSHTEEEMRKLGAFLKLPIASDHLEQFKHQAKFLFHSWELWKSGVCHSISPHMAMRENEQLNEPDRYTLWTIAGRHMKKYGYHFNPQKIGFFSRIENGMRGIWLEAKVSRRRLFRILPPFMTNRVRQYYHLLRRLLIGGRR